MRIEFGVDEARPRPGHTIVTGRVHQGEIALGDVFTILTEAPGRLAAPGARVELPTAEHSVALQVVGIEAYRQSLEFLSTGMTGLLRLTGSGQVLLQRVDPSEGYGSWLLQSDKFAQPCAAADGGT